MRRKLLFFLKTEREKGIKEENKKVSKKAIKQARAEETNKEENKNCFFSIRVRTPYP